MFFLLIFIYLIIILNNCQILFILKYRKAINKEYNDSNFEYHKFQNEIISEKIKKYSGLQQNIIESYFINGIIRKFKPKKCLEIGVANGGSAILILNAIKDIKDSILISLDLNKELYIDKTKKTGYRVKKYFPELCRNWKLFTGELPHIFLAKLNIKFDFLFLDTAHYAPGELINLIEVLPFLNEGAIVVLHDIIWHFNIRGFKEIKFTPTQIYIMSSLFGQKIYLKNNFKGFNNIGAVILYPGQENHYLDYFLLLMSFWDEMITEKQINQLRLFISKYYKKDIYLRIFNSAINLNKNYILKYKKILNKCLK